MASSERLLTPGSSPDSLSFLPNLVSADAGALAGIPLRSSVGGEQRVDAGRCPRCHPGPMWLFFFLFLSLFVAMSPYFCTLATLVTADAVYTPVFNTTDVRRVVTGPGRSSFSLIGFRSEEFPIAVESVVDGVAERSNGTYSPSGLSDAAFFACHYSAYSTVTAVTASGNFGTAGELIDLPLPGCAALRLARAAFIAYMSLFFFSVVTSIGVWEMMYGKLRSDDTTRKLGLPCWRAAVALTCLVVLFGAVQGGAMWAFASDTAFEHAAINGGVLFAHMALIALLAPLQTWNLNNLYWDVRKVRAGAMRDGLALV